MEWTVHPSPERKGAAAHLDRRKRQRTSAQGEIVLIAVGTRQGEIRGRLLDVCPEGFRVAHDCRVLVAGQRVLFFHATAEGEAVIAWTRILNDRVESGFHIGGAVTFASKTTGPK